MRNEIFDHPVYGEMYYLLEIPKELENVKNRPLLVFLHGAGERGFDHELIKKNAVPKLIEEGLVLPAVTICPQCRKDAVWSNQGAFLKALIDDVVAHYDIDPDRISITGISMGGYGTWEMITQYPSCFYKAAPVCGGGISWRAGEIRTPAWAFHGDADNVVPVRNSYEMIDAMIKSGADPDKARLTIFHNVMHNSWDMAYEETNLLKWLLS